MVVFNLQRALSKGFGPADVVGKVSLGQQPMLLGFSASALRSDPGRALIANVNVGAAPIALVMVRGGSRILVADTNLHNQHGATSDVAVIAVPAALRGGHALLGTFGTGLGREFALSPDGSTLLLSDNNAGRLQAIDVSTLP